MSIQIFACSRRFRGFISYEFTREEYRENNVRLVALFDRPEHYVFVPKLAAVYNPGSRNPFAKRGCGESMAKHLDSINQQHRNLETIAG